MAAETFEFDFDEAKSRAGVEKKVFIRIPKKGSEGWTFLTLGTLNRVSWNTNIQLKPIYSLGRKSANGAGTGVKSINGVLSFNVMDTSTIEYLKKQAAEAGIDAEAVTNLRMSELPRFDVVLISADENDVSGRHSKRIIRGIQINSESTAAGSDVIAMNEEYTFKAISVSSLQEHEIKAFDEVIGG